MQIVHFYEIDPAFTGKNGEPMQTPLVAVLSRLSAAPVGIKLSLRLNSIRRRVLEHQKEIVEQRERLANLYGEKDEAGAVKEGEQPGTIRVTKEYFEQNMELMQTTFEAPAIYASELANLPDLSANDLLALGDILVDDVTESAESAKPNAPVHANGNAPAHASRRRRRRKSASAH